MQANFQPAQAADFQRRSDALAAAVRAAGLDHYVVGTGENIFYLTGATFEPLERPFFLVIGADGARRMLVPVLELDHLRKAWGLRPEQISSYREYPAPPGEGWADRLLDGGLLGARFGFEEGLPWSVGERLRAAGGTALDLLEPLRIVKSPWEIEQVERAARYADWGVREVLRRAWAGATVAETYAATQSLTRKIIREVADWDPLATKVIAAAWPAPLSAEPHAIPHLGDRLLAGPHVALVLTRVNGYAAECERTFFTVAPDARQRELFATMERAREIAFGMLRPGVACAEIDTAVNTFLDGSGFADFRTRLHRCGHGFGLGNHEPPWLALGSPHVLQQNMLVSIEPGVYVHGAGGFRHSDTVLVTRDGYRCLTRSPSRLQDLVRTTTTLRHRVTGWAVRRAIGLA
ncbi:MAG: metallopeptidase family protein [Ramlibacter sp.]|jgi:Xaa-Pro dipeptidase|nr:metallopeptidase family protein [Ramlibacter sp.]